ncbi:MAG: flavoprotein, partial [Bacteroidota bacterium]|nr:flavoprotein [Bacteroidota bacterium]
MKIVLAITGASGAIYAQRIIFYLEKKVAKNDVAVVFTDAGKQVWEHEIRNLSIKDIPFKIYSNNDFFVPFASGSSKYNTMIIAPCTMGTLGK